MHLFKDSKMGLTGLDATRPGSRTGNHQELTLSYLMGTSSSKGKEIAIGENHPTGSEEEKWVERDFLNLGRGRHELAPKREAAAEEEDGKEADRMKKPKLEGTLSLSLALPSASMSLTASNFQRSAAPPAAPSTTNNTQTTYSNDFSAPSMSYSHSHPFSHNPSCSLTCNSTENYQFSVGKDDPIWCGGEGTNGSVYSRFKPIGDSLVELANPSNISNQGTYKPGSNANGDDNMSYFPSELPARPWKDKAMSDHSSGRHSDHIREFEVRAKRASMPERLVRDIVMESVPTMAHTLAELPDEVLQTSKDRLKALIAAPERREELLGLQKCLDRRVDLTKETLVKCHKDQLSIMVSIRTGLQSFLSDKIQVPTSELVDIFLYLRCRNLNCKSHLPVDDCECKICSANKGFCGSCMCPVCLKFDCANNTCSWVGCDVCSHWCHASCGLQQNLIRPGPSLKGPRGVTEMLSHCIGCGHASEMFGFVKDVFTCCAKDWGLETLMKELDCVRKIFRMAEDRKGRELYGKAGDLLLKLENKMVSTSDACSMILKFFNDSDRLSEFAAAPSSYGNEKYERPPAAAAGFHKKELKLPSRFAEDELGTMASSDGRAAEEMFGSIEGIIMIKQAEARMFQNMADEARREAEMYKEMIRAKMEKLDEDYAQRLSKLSLQETEDRRRKKLEELKALENSHSDYQKMKMRMQAEIAGLWERMEATAQQLA